MPINPAIPTAPAQWVREVDTRVVEVFIADVDLSAFFRKQERGIIDDLTDQELVGPSLPYNGVKIIGFPRDDYTDEVGFTHHVLKCRCQVGAVAAKQGQAEDIVIDGMAMLMRVVGREKTGEMFSLVPADGRSNINDIDVGGGTLQFNGRNRNNMNFISVGNYEFDIHYNLYIGR